MNTILFFDLDATLVENHFSRKALFPLLEEISLVSGISVPDLARAMGKENERRQKTDPDNLLTMDWADIVESLAKQHGVSLSDSVDSLWNAVANAADVEILDESPSVLASLKNGKRKLVLSTKGLWKYQESVLKVAGLLHSFDDILTPDKTGYLKTTAQYFDKYRNEKALFIQVGDHFYDDVICAKRNGFISIMRAPIADLAGYDALERPKYLDAYLQDIGTYPKEGSAIRPDALVLSLQELPDLIAHFEANGKLDIQHGETPFSVDLMMRKRK